MRYSIVGQKWKNLDPYLPGIAAGSTAYLVREPANPADPNAVAVYVDGLHVGYIPKAHNELICRYIEAKGETFDRLQPAPGLALDEAARARGAQKAIAATFVRSPNSAYPQIDLPDFDR